MNATIADIRSAASILDQNPAGAGGNGFDGLSAFIDDATLNTVVDVGSFGAGFLPDPFDSWIRQGLSTFNEIVDGLRGDTARIAVHIGNLTSASKQVEAQQDALIQAGSTAGGCWSGPAADAFQQTIEAAKFATMAVVGVLNYDAERHRALTNQLGTTRSGIFDLLQALAGGLVEAAQRFIAQMGLALAGGAGDIVVGTVSGAIDGAVDGWNSGGFFGAVGGFFSGIGDGFSDGVEEAKARLAEAFNRFVEWAHQKLVDVIATVRQFAIDHIEPMVETIGLISGAGIRAERAASLLRGNGDPGTMSDPPAPGSYGASSMGSTPQPQDGDIIAVNEAIGDPNAPLPEGYSRATDDQLASLGLTRDMLTDENGFQAEVFINPDGKYIVAFAGTGAGGGDFAPDAAEDAIGAFTVSPHTEQILRLTDALQASGQSDDVVFTGHSLGGRQAAIAAMATGNAAITYDAAGVSPATIDYIAAKNGVDPQVMLQQANDGQIRRYYAGNDPLTAAQERWSYAPYLPDAVGSPIQLGPTANSEVPGFDLGYGEYNHGHDLSHAGDLWRQTYGDHGERIGK